MKGKKKERGVKGMLEVFAEAERRKKKRKKKKREVVGDAKVR